MTDSTIAKEMNALLADATIFYQKLRHYHWNVDGRHFFQLHDKFEELYTEWADSIDEIAERILTVDAVPLHTLASMLDAADLKEDPDIPAGEEMVRRIMGDLEAIRDRAGKIIETAEDADDRGTANLLDDIRDGIEKNLWMLGAWQKR